MSAFLGSRNMQHMGSNLSRYLVVFENLSEFMECVIRTINVLRLIVSELIIIRNRVQSVNHDTCNTLRNKIKLITTARALCSICRLPSSQEDLKRHITLFAERFLSPVVSTEETTLIGRISDVVRSGHGSDFDFDFVPQSLVA